MWSEGFVWCGEATDQVVGQVPHDGVDGHNVGPGSASILGRACSMTKVFSDQ
jgi:hypothetical protein